jgi:hypothetical protein
MLRSWNLLIGATAFRQGRKTLTIVGLLKYSCFELRTARCKDECAGIGKGCDIGYALVISSCEEANSVDACTVAALDAITAFAVPNPNCSSQSQSVFSGLVVLRVTPANRSLSLLRTGQFYLCQPFSRRRQPT